jgi:phenylacetate-coenzyme A ligase PaaK-like adenylate-forming protein
MEDFLYKFLALFQALPLPVKRFVGWIYNGLPKKIKYGNFYGEYLNRINKFQSSTSAGLCVAEQEKLLFKQLNNAIEKVHAYKHYPKVDRMADFKKLPLISKSSIIEDEDQFINPAFLNKRIKANTGGSSGTPMEFFIEKDVSRPKEKSHFDWYWGLFGYSVGDRILMVRGTPLHGNRSHEYSPIGNTLNVSCYNINEANIEAILARINKFKPKFIHAYPSSLKIITSLLEKHKHMINFKVDALFLGSEHLRREDRKYFSEFYGGHVVNWYGHSERLIHGGNCPYTDEFHFFPFYGLMELLDENDEPVTQANVEGRIVATGFDNQVMPFIRYDTGDRGVLSEVRDCKCGFKGLTLKEIAGRGQDVIVLFDGTRVTLTAFIYGQHLDSFRKIREMQVVQEKKGEIEIRIVKNESFTPSDAKKMISTLAGSVDHKIKIRLEYLDNLPKTTRGKSKFFISHLQHEM